MDKLLLSFFYKWHRFEKQNHIDIIDFDLIQEGNKYLGQFKDRKEVLGELETLIKKYSVLPHKNQFILDKLKASLYYLKALMGVKFPFDSYVSNTMGLKPKMIEEKVLKEVLKLKINAYKKVGYEYTKDDLKRFNKENELTKSEIESSFKSFRDTLVPQVLDWLGLKIDLMYKIKFVDKDVYWMNWISTDDNGEILLQYNLNKRHKWVKGSTEFLVFHEICAHAIQTLSWKQQIKIGKLHPFIGLTTVFSPEQFLLEGIAESLFYFYPSNPFSDYGAISLYADHLYWLVMNNAHIMVNSGVDQKEILEFIESYLPNSNKSGILKNLEERKNHPLFRTYQYIYGISLYYHMKIARRLSPKKRREYVTDIYHNAYTPSSILKRLTLTDL